MYDVVKMPRRPSLRQKLAIQKVLENPSMGVSRAMLEVGYAPTTAENPRELTDSKAWHDLVDKHLPDSILVTRHLELLNKRESHVVSAGPGLGSSIEMTDQPDTAAVTKALDMAYKLKRKYPQEGLPPGSGNPIVNILVQIQETEQRLAKEGDIVEQDAPAEAEPGEEGGSLMDERS
jgi:hypothetical protein